MEKLYRLYVHEFPDGKKYFGITTNKPERRWQNGFGYRHQTDFYKAILECGWDNMAHRVIKEGLTKEEAERLETEYIKRYDTMNPNKGYNRAEGAMSGYHLTDEHRKKIGQANSGVNNGMYGHKYTEEERRKMSEESVWRGRKHTEESRKKMSEALKGHTRTKKGAEHPGARAVNQYTKDNVFIRRYDTAREAGRITGALCSSICNCVKGKQKTAGGYIWRYADVN